MRKRSKTFCIPQCPIVNLNCKRQNGFYWALPHTPFQYNNIQLRSISNLFDVTRDPFTIVTRLFLSINI